MKKISFIRAKLPGAIRKRFRNCKTCFSTQLAYISAWWWQVELGKGCRFNGSPVFLKAYNSSIVIGDKCRFSSAMTSNPIGINRACMLSTFREGASLVIGKNSGLSGTVIGCADKIEIGKGVLCGANVTITDFDWHNTEPEKRHGHSCTNSRPIKINDNVWLGLNVIVLKGVTIGKNSVIAAGSIVTKDIPANMIAAGQPARVIKALDASA